MLKRLKVGIVLLTIGVLIISSASIVRAWTQEDAEEIKDKQVQDTDYDLSKGASESPENSTVIHNTLPPERDILAPDPPLNEWVLVYVNGQFILWPDQVSYIDVNNRTMVPIRFVAERLGSKVEWEPETQTVNIKRDNTEIILKIGESTSAVNGEVKTFDTQAVLTPKGRTMVPLRFITETMGGKVEWDSINHYVWITL